MKWQAPCQHGPCEVRAQIAVECRATRVIQPVEARQKVRARLQQETPDIGARGRLTIAIPQPVFPIHEPLEWLLLDVLTNPLDLSLLNNSLEGRRLDLGLRPGRAERQEAGQQQAGHRAGPALPRLAGGGRCGGGLRLFQDDNARRHHEPPETHHHGKLDLFGFHRLEGCVQPAEV